MTFSAFPLVSPWKPFRRALLVGATLGLAILPVAAEMEVVLDARPGTVLVGFSSGKFKLLGETETGRGTITEQEAAGSVGTIPSVRLGLGWDTRRWFLDMEGAFGTLLSGYFRCLTMGAEGAAQYKFRKNVSGGPHLGLFYLAAPEWGGDAEVEFSESWGGVLGGQVLLGYDVQFVFSIDYFYTDPLDVETKGTWTTEDETLDLSGVAIQFGIRGRF